MKTTTILKSILFLSLLAAVGCGRKGADDATSDSFDSTESMLEAGVTVVSGMADEQAGSSMSYRSEKPKPSIWVLFAPETALAANCARAVFATCGTGERSAIYSACAVPGTQLTLSGHVNLSYSRSDCSMAVTGDTVEREYDVEMTGPRGGVFSLSSASATDYRGQTFGGGGRLEKTAGGWRAEVAGRHSSFTRNGRRLMSVSVRTLAPLDVTGTLARSGRTVNSGQLEVNHNLAGFTAIFAPTNVQWSGSCCHPTSGTLGVTYSGSKTGSATVQFTGCGTADVTEGGQTRSVTLSYCE